MRQINEEGIGLESPIISSDENSQTKIISEIELSDQEEKINLMKRKSRLIDQIRKEYKNIQKSE